MFVFLFGLSSCGFNDYFACSPIMLESISSWTYNTNGCYFLQMSLFDKITSTNSAIYVNANSVFLYISKSDFISCASSIEGGAIRFSSSGGGIAQEYSCSYSCYSSSTSSYGQFSHQTVAVSQPNSVLYSSVSLCCPFPSYDRRAPIYTNSGKPVFHYNNFSNNYASYDSAFRIDYGNELSISYTTILNNKANDRQCTNIKEGTGIKVMNYTNYIGNNSPLTHGSVLIWDTTFFIKKCIFYENTNTLFYVYSSGKLTVSESYISHDYTVKTGTLVELAADNQYQLTNSYTGYLKKNAQCTFLSENTLKGKSYVNIIVRLVVYLCDLY